VGSQGALFLESVSPSLLPSLVRVWGVSPLVFGGWAVVNAGSITPDATRAMLFLFSQRAASVLVGGQGSSF